MEAVVGFGGLPSRKRAERGVLEPELFERIAAGLLGVAPLRFAFDDAGQSAAEAARADEKLVLVLAFDVESRGGFPCAFDPAKQDAVRLVAKAHVDFLGVVKLA